MGIIYHIDDKFILFLIIKIKVKTARFSPDGRLIASGSDDKTVKIWDTETHNELYSFDDFTGPVS